MALYGGNLYFLNMEMILFLCLFVAPCSTGFPLTCKWMDNHFRGCSIRSINLINTMATYYTATDDGKDKNTVGFPKELYKAMHNASAEEKLSFTVQVLEEVDVLFEEDHSSASWEKIIVEHFRIAVTRQAEGLGECIHKYRQRTVNKKLRVYFKNLSCHILARMGHSAKAWELIRREIRIHLLRLDLLIAPLLSAKI